MTNNTPPASHPLAFAKSCGGNVVASVIIMHENLLRTVRFKDHTKSFSNALYRVKVNNVFFRDRTTHH